MKVEYPYNAAITCCRRGIVSDRMTFEDLTNGYKTSKPWDPEKTAVENCEAALDSYIAPRYRDVLGVAEYEKGSGLGVIFLVRVKSPDL